MPIGAVVFGSAQFAAPIRKRSERPGAVLAYGNGRGRVGAVRLLGRRLGPEGRASLEVVPAAGCVAHEMGVRRDHNPLLALRVLDDDAWIAGAGKRCTNRTGWLHEAVRHRAIGCAVPALVIVAAVRLWPGEDTQFDRLLAAVRLRHPARADVVTRLDVRECRLQHG